LGLARQCGINVPESRIEAVGGTAEGYTRARMMSGLTVLRSDETNDARPLFIAER
jgi:serine/threonine-protein kinase HipA